MTWGKYAQSLTSIKNSTDSAGLDRVGQKRGNEAMSCNGNSTSYYGSELSGKGKYIILIISVRTNNYSSSARL